MLTVRGTRLHCTVGPASLPRFKLLYNLLPQHAKIPLRAGFHLSSWSLKFLSGIFTASAHFAGHLPPGVGIIIDDSPDMEIQFGCKRKRNASSAHMCVRQGHPSNKKKKEAQNISAFLDSSYRLRGESSPTLMTWCHFMLR